MATVNLGRIGFVNKGTYNGATAYKVNDVVTYNAGTYACIQANTGQAPTNTSYWQNWVADNAVHKTGDETIAGVKTFTSSPVVPTPITDFQVATKQYVDGKLPSTATDNAIARFDGSGGAIQVSNVFINDSAEIQSTSDLFKMIAHPSSPDNQGYFEPYGTDGWTKIYNSFAYGGGIKFFTNKVERARIDVLGNMYYNSGYGSAAIAYGCRAWVNFNGTGTVAIRASGNVSSITDNGVGNYTVNFTTAMPDANYTTNCTNGSSIISHTNWITGVLGAQLVNSVRIATTNGGTDIFADREYVFVSIFR